MKELNIFEIESVSGGVLTEAEVKTLIVESSIVGGFSVGVLTGALGFGEGISGMTVVAASVGGIYGMLGGFVLAIPCYAVYDIYSKLS